MKDETLDAQIIETENKKRDEKIYNFFHVLIDLIFLFVAVQIIVSRIRDPISNIWITTLELMIWIALILATIYIRVIYRKPLSRKNNDRWRLTTLYFAMILYFLIVS